MYNALLCHKAEVEKVLRTYEILDFRGGAQAHRCREEASAERFHLCLLFKYNSGYLIAYTITC
jgi:hypothetical protein